MTNNVEAFDHWIRTAFVQMNTELENLYCAGADRAQVTGIGDRIKAALRDEGHGFVVELLAEGNTGDGLVKRFIEGPAAALNQEHLQGITASGPPLPVMLRSLELLRDLPVTADRPDIATRHHDLAALPAALKTDLT